MSIIMLVYFLLCHYVSSECVLITAMTVMSIHKQRSEEREDNTGDFHSWTRTHPCGFSLLIKIQP